MPIGLERALSVCGLGAACLCHWHSRAQSLTAQVTAGSNLELMKLSGAPKSPHRPSLGHQEGKLAPFWPDASGAARVWGSSLAWPRRWRPDRGRDWLWEDCFCHQAQWRRASGASRRGSTMGQQLERAKQREREREMQKKPKRNGP